MFTISEKIRQASEQAEISAKDSFEKIDDILAYNTEKVLYAFAKNKVSEACFKGSTGYGYDDLGRDVLDAVYADIFKAEDALVRHNFVSGTHALTVALFGLLRTGDTLLCITGSPYDTLEEVIGIRGEKGNGSLSDFGVKYDKVDLKDDGSFDKDGILEKLSGAKVVYIQRSRGYSLRPAITISQMEDIIKACKEKNPDVIVMVDNCYGEFVEKREPTEVGADICVGSLIKNAGGGIAETGGYIVGFLFLAMAYWVLTSLLGEKLPVMVAAMVLGLLICYAFGTVWFMIVYAKNNEAVGLWTALGWCVFPFIIPDLLKMALAILLTKRLGKYVKL